MRPMMCGAVIVAVQGDACRVRRFRPMGRSQKRAQETMSRAIRSLTGTQTTGGGGAKQCGSLTFVAGAAAGRRVWWMMAGSPNGSRAGPQRDAARGQYRIGPRRLRYPGLEIAVRCEPLEDVGGDFVDVVTMPDGRVLLMVADVCGNGLPAALVAMSLHGIVDCCARDGHDLPDIAQRLNSHLQFRHPDGPFVSLACVAIDLENGTSQSLNAGHPPLLVAQPHGALRRLKSGSTFPLGIAAIEPRIEQDLVSADEYVLFYSDGWTELCDGSGQMLGIPGLGCLLLAVCDELHAAPLGEILNALYDRLVDFQGPAPIEDDRTLMLVRQRIAGR